MIRRLIVLSALAYAVIAIQKASAKKAESAAKDALARADWESEGGRPLPAAGYASTV